jgi:hypothetical protein
MAMPSRSLYYLLLLQILTALPLDAEELRVIRGDAIINVVRPAGVTAYTSPDLFDRISNSSFSSLSEQRLSTIATRISLKRKMRSGNESERFRKSRSSCNSLVIKRLLRVAKRLSCEPNWEARISLIPNDQYYSSLYSVNQLHLTEAWDKSTGSDSIVVGVIDTGIDYNHPDLAANMWINPGEIADNSIDDDSNGYVDDIHGVDRINIDSDPIDDQSHGTHVAGTIGAIGNNSIGIAGIAWNVKQIGCKAFNAAGMGSIATVISCINYLVNLKKNHGINIVATNNSYGGFPYSVGMFNAIAASRDANMVFVAGAGNNGTNNDSAPFYPASYQISNVISVAANDSSKNKANFSNFGVTSVDISAPGVSVLSTIPGSNQYAWFNGTSMATPHVTGAVALLMAYCETCNYSQAIDSIINSGTEVAGLAGTSVSGAILNVDAALDYAAALTPPTSTPTPDPNDSPDSGELDLSSARLTISALKSKMKSKLSCALSAMRNEIYEGLEGRLVKLSIKGVKKQRKAITNEAGEVSFTIRPPKGVSWSVRCIASLTNPETGAAVSVKSALTKVTLGKP